MQDNPISKLVRANILALEPYTSYRDTLKEGSYTLLDANENPFGDYNRYPDSTQKVLKERLSGIKGISAKQITIGNGSDELIDLIVKIFCEPNKDAIVVMNPSFAMYEFYAKVNGNEVIKLNLNTDFQLSKEEFLAKTNVENAKVLFLCSPNNPTGNSVNDIEFYIQNFKGIVVVDEAYIEFSDKESMLSKINNYDNVIVLQTLSKAWGLAGLRIGMAFSSEFIINLINTVKSPYNISDINSKTALKELAYRDVFTLKMNNIKLQKEKLLQVLTKAKCVKKVYPSDANFFLVEFINVENVYDIFLSQKILTSKRFPSIPNTLRINIGTNEENEKLIKIINMI